MTRYAELQVTTHFSFLRGASSADELFATAAALGIDALGVVDRNSLAGIVRAWEAAQEAVYNCLVAGRPAPLRDGVMQDAFPIELVDFRLACLILRLGLERLDPVPASDGSLAMLFTLVGQSFKQLEHGNAQAVRLLGSGVEGRETLLNAR